jgi:hypothetical protein
MRQSWAMCLARTALLAAALCLVGSTCTAAESYRNQTSETVLKTLRKGHPRLILLEADRKQIQKMIAENPVARKYSEDLRRAAIGILDEKPVEYIIVGPRLLSQSRRCLDRIYSLGLAYQLSGEERFAARAKQELMAAAAFPDWNPSHFLDTAEMCHAFAIGYDWLQDSLNAEDRRIIREAIIEKGLKPALSVYEKGGWWTTSRYNWNQVCNGGIGIGALAIADEEPRLAGEILSYALKSIPPAMVTFGPEGGFAEGPGYWNYASRYAVYFLAALETALGSDFGLAEIPGFPEAGLFRIYFCGPIGRTFNFADAGDRSGDAAQMFWMAKKFDQPVYAWHERSSVRRAEPLHLIWFDPRGQGPAATNLPLDRHFKGLDAVFFRSKWEDQNAIFIGFKGGDNRVNHSHLDLGSFVLDALGHRWALDLGGDDYNLPGYFGSKRWTYYRLNTESHNTLFINGENQLPSAPAPIIGFASSRDFAWAVADLTAAYPDVDGKVWRGVALVDRASMLVQDEITSDKPVEALWGMLTDAKVELNGRSALLTHGDARLLARILQPAEARFELLSANPPRPQRQQPDVQKLAVRLPGNVKNLRLAVLLSPYWESDPKPEDLPQIRPLEEWIQSLKR